MIIYMMYAWMWMKYDVFLFIEYDFFIHRFFLVMREAGTSGKLYCLGLGSSRQKENKEKEEKRKKEEGEEEGEEEEKKNKKRK